MLDQIRKLVRLQKIDQHLGELLRHRENASRKVTDTEGSLQHERQKQNEWKERLSVRKNEEEQTRAQIRDIESQLAKLEAKQQEVKTTKEYDAVRKEFESAEQTKQTLEEGITAISTEIVELESNLRESERRISSLKTTLESVKSELARVLEKVGREEEELQEKRKELAGTIKAPLLRKYERIRKYKMGLGIAEAKDGACTACHMSVPSQQYSRILRGELLECQNCQRILYHETILEQNASK